MLDLGYDISWPIIVANPVNRDHPLNQGRAAWWTTLPELSGGSTFYDLTGLYPGTLTGMTTAGTGWQPTNRPGGFGHLNFSGTSNYVATGYAGLSGASTFTLALWFRRLATSTQAIFFGAGDNNNANRVVLQAWSDGILYLTMGIGIYGYFTSNDTNWHRYLASYDGTQTGNTNRLKVYLDGVPQTLTYGGTVPATMPTFTAKVNINSDPGASYGTSIGDDFTLWNRALSPAEARADYDLSRRGYPGVLNRWRPTRFGAVAAGGATLLAATGVFGFTGNDANLLAGRVLPAGAGSYALTGNSAGLFTGRVIAASAGVYVLTGNDANLVYTQAGAYTLVAGTGSFALTGNDAGLLVSRVLTAEAGAYVLTGRAASLAWSGETVATTLTFRETLLAKLESIADVTAIVGTAIYPGALPMTHDLGRNGAAITYTVATYARGHVLTGSDGTATARVQFSAWSFDASESDAITLAIWDALDRPPVNPWVAGGVEILSVVQIDESDQFEPPRAGGDQWVYQIVSEYAITHRAVIS